jgi:hypothetical protein
MAALVCAAGAAGAQTPAPIAAERPAVSLTLYRSAFEGYRPYVEETPAPWREVNDTVGRVGGHMGVLRAEEQPAAPQPAPAPAEKDPSHDAHHRK